jgi:hypothetical protein
MTEQWFYSANKRRVGPVPLDYLRHLASTGNLQPADMVLQVGSSKWVVASSVAGLFASNTDATGAPQARALTPGGVTSDETFKAMPVRQEQETVRPRSGREDRDVWRHRSRHHSERTVYPTSTAAHSLGISSLVLGVVAFIVSLIPCLGIVSLPVAGLGLLLGIMGLVIAISRNGTGIGFPIAGSGLNSLALLIAAFWLYLGYAVTVPNVGRSNVGVDISDGGAGELGPNEQRKFMESLESFISAYNAAPNELKKSSLRIDRKEAIKKLLPSLRVRDWEGILEPMTTNSNGDATIRVKLGQSDSVRLVTHGGWSSFSARPVRIGTPVYAKFADLQAGDAILVSGEFVIGTRDYLAEVSMTERGSMTDPAFIFIFDDVKKRR